MPDELHIAKDEVHLAYYAAVLDTLKRYIADGNAFRLTTDFDGGHTTVALRFETSDLSPYMAQLDASAEGPENWPHALVPHAKEPPAFG